MEHEEIIIIDDSEDEVEVENEEVVSTDSEDEEGSDMEIEPASDSDYDSDGVFTDRRVQTLTTAEIIAIDDIDSVRMCVVTLFYTPWDNTKVCTRCFLRQRINYTEVCVVRAHKTARYDQIIGRWCDDCGASVDQLYPRNMCPVCHW